MCGVNNRVARDQSRAVVVWVLVGRAVSTVSGKSNKWRIRESMACNFGYTDQNLMTGAELWAQLNVLSVPVSGVVKARHFGNVAETGGQEAMAAA